MAQTLARPVANLIDLLARLPGVGPKTASRLTFYLLREPNGLADALAEALGALEQRARWSASSASTLPKQSPCPICSDAGARPVADLRGRGADGPAGDRAHGRRITASITCCTARCRPSTACIRRSCGSRNWSTGCASTPPREVILATNPSLEGENTAAYIFQQLVERRRAGDAAGARAADGRRPGVRRRGDAVPRVGGPAVDVSTRAASACGLRGPGGAIGGVLKNDEGPI